MPGVQIYLEYLRHDPVFPSTVMYSGRAAQVLAVAVVFTILSWVTVLLRLWVRSRIIKAFGRDDWAMVAAQIVFTAYLVCQLGGVVHGTGQHLRDLDPSRAETALKFWFFCEVLYVLATILMKIAIGFLLLRIAIARLHIVIIHLAMWSSTVFGGAFFIVLVFQCWPIYAFWTLDPNDGHCINSNVLSALTYTISALNVVADWTFAILPVFIVKDLQMAWKKKAMVAAILAFGAVGSTATIVRLPSVWSMKESSLGWNGDFLYDTVGIAVWSTVEVGVGITAGCIATLWPLMQMLLETLGLGTTHPGTHSKMLTQGADAGAKQSPGLPLHGLAPDHGITTVITSKRHKSQHSVWRSQNSSEEQLAGPDNITKHVTVECDEVDAVVDGRDGSGTYSNFSASR